MAAIGGISGPAEQRRSRRGSIRTHLTQAGLRVNGKLTSESMAGCRSNSELHSG